MKHVYTLLLLLMVSGGLLIPAQAQTTVLPQSSLLSQPVQNTKQVPGRKGVPVQNAITAATIRYVKAGASGNGTSWSNASGDLQAMINASAAGDQVWISGGTYKPSTTGLSDVRAATFSLKNGVSVLGGFTGNPGTEGNSTARTAIPSSTTLSGDIGTAGVANDNVYHVVFNGYNGLDNSAILDGVAITGGYANGSGNDSFGGGIYNIFSSPSILNCLISQNYGASGAGAVDNAGTSVSPKFTNCNFVNNTGASIAGFYDEQSSTGSILVNCYFENNLAGNVGGLATATTKVPTLTNCTFRGNRPNGVYCQQSTPILINCLLWDNGGSSAIQGGPATISNSALEQGVTNYTDGGNNRTLTTSPFANTTGPQLSQCAPAVDAGNDAANTTTTDVLGNARKLRTIDIGAAEFQGAPYVAPTISNLFQSATTVCQGSQVSFSFDITGGSDGVTSANFYRDNTNLGGAGITSPAGVSGQIRRAFSINESGTYKFVAVSTCSSLTITYAPITVNPLPASYSVTGGGAYCAGSVGSVVGLSGSETGVNYQLLRGGTATGTSVPGTGNPITFGPQSTTGTYTVLATNTSTNCTQTMSGSAVVSINALPTVSITPSATAVCQGQSATFAATPGLTSYRWTTPNNGPVLTTAIISVSVAGTYSLTVTNSNSCSATATASLTVNALPTVSITPPAVTICAGQSTTLTASGANTYRWSTTPTQTTASISVSVAGPYSVTGTNTATGCSNTATANVTVTPLPNASFTGLPASVCVDAPSSTLMPTTPGGSFSGPGISGNQFSPASATAGGPYSITYTVSSMGCSNSSIQQVTVNPLPMAPMIATQSGHSYPGGVSSLTISQNTGNVILMTSGCIGGTITWAGGASSTLAVSTMNTGVQTFTATCTSNATGCTSPVATATVTVVAPTLKVFSRDPDNGQLGNNTIKPYLLLQNAGTIPIPYATITLRYWLTTENNIPLIFQKNYVAIGQNNLSLRYVALDQPLQGATGYIEYSFSPSAGSLGAMGDSGPLEIQVYKQDYSQFDQRDDYSYINNSAYTLNPRITAYQNGTIFYGMEPTGVSSARQAVEEPGMGLEVRVLGNPVHGASVEVMVSGAEGQPLTLSLTDLSGRSVSTRQVERAGNTELQWLEVGNASAGMLLLRVSTPTQNQTVKVLRR